MDGIDGEDPRTPDYSSPITSHYAQIRNSKNGLARVGGK